MTKIFTDRKSILDVDREREIFQEAVPHGVFEGMVPKAGTGNLKVSLHGGWYAVNGVLIYEDNDFTDLFDLDGPYGNGGGRHYKFYVYFYNGDDPDPFLSYLNSNNIDPNSIGYTSGEPFYDIAKGDFSSPVQEEAIPGNEPVNENSLWLGEAWIPNSATDISNDGVHITSRDITPSSDDIYDIALSEYEFSTEAITFSVSRGTLSVRWREMALWGYSGQYNHLEKGPLKRVRIEGDNTPSDTSPYFYQQEITRDLKGADGALLYVRSRRQVRNSRNNFNEDRFDEKLQYFPLNFDGTRPDTIDDWWDTLSGDSTGYAGDDRFPFRPQFDSIYPIGLLRKVEDPSQNTTEWVLSLRSGEILHDSAHFALGKTYQYVSSIFSTTTNERQDVNLETGDIDLDDVIPNLGTIYAATLDDAYDSFDPNTPDGAGHEIIVDNDSVRLDHRENEAQDLQEAIEVETGYRTFLNGRIAPTRVGIGAHATNQAVTTRMAVARQRTPLDGVIDGHSVYFHQKEVTVEVRANGDDLELNMDAFNFNSSEFYTQNSTYSERYLNRHTGITFSNGGGVDAENRVYGIHYDGTYTQLIQPDDRLDADPDSPFLGEFNLSSAGDTLTLDATIWEFIDLSKTSVFRSFEAYEESRMEAPLVIDEADHLQTNEIRATTGSSFIEFLGPTGSGNTDIVVRDFEADNGLISTDLEVRGDIELEGGLHPDTGGASDVVQILDRNRDDRSTGGGATVTGEEFVGDNPAAAYGRLQFPSGALNSINLYNIQNISRLQDGRYLIELPTGFNADSATYSHAIISAAYSGVTTVRHVQFDPYDTSNGNEVVMETYNSSQNLVQSQDSEISFTVHTPSQ